jgi:hypothetical protein
MPAKIARERRTDRNVEEYTTVFREGSYSDAQITKMTRLRIEGLNQREWSTLHRQYDLPDEARFSIDLTISGYWKFRVDNSISKELPSKIDDVAAHLNKLTGKLADLRADPDFFKGVFAYYNPSPTEQAETIDRTLDSLDKVHRLLDQARVRIRGPKNRPTHRGLFQGIATLEAHMKRWERFNGDFEKFNYEVFRLADPMITKRSFRVVINQYNSIRPKWDSTGFWVEHHHR